MKHNNICVEHNSSLNNWDEYTRGVFLCKRQDVSHLKKFGSLVDFHVTKDARKNIEPKTKLGIFVGYNDTPQSYWVYFPAHKMTMVRRDVKFDEEKAMKIYLEKEL